MDNRKDFGYRPAVTPMSPAYKRMLADAARRRAKVLERFLAGKTVTQLAKEMGLSKQRVSTMLKRARTDRAPA